MPPETREGGLNVLAISLECIYSGVYIVNAEDCMGTPPEGWAREWEDRSIPLFDLLSLAEQGTEMLPELMRNVRACRTVLSPAPLPHVQELADRALDEIWEAARLSVYGDVLLASEHTAVARAHAQEIRKLMALATAS